MVNYKYINSHVLSFVHTERVHVAQLVSYRKEEPFTGLVITMAAAGPVPKTENGGSNSSNDINYVLRESLI